ncbi:MAG: hypothetical protein P8R42_15755 [Candidatus Binatia bacterium]|nr:hypothetical protein [Candidatus Binatia bacterium]
MKCKVLFCRSLPLVLAALLVGCGDSESESQGTNNSRTIELLRRLDWDTSTPEWVKVEPEGGFPALLADPNFRDPVRQINTFAVFADWFYRCLPTDSDTKHFLEYFMATAYDSEDFIWNQRGLLPSGYEAALPVVRGSAEYLPGVSSWTTDSERGREFPVLNSAAADSIIGLVMKQVPKDFCAIGFGQWQQNYVSGSILTLPWSVPVDTDQNPVVFQDDADASEAVSTGNPNRHKFVLGPITWLSMALDVRAWDRQSEKSSFESTILQGREHWQHLHENVGVNEALCKQFTSEEETQGPYPPVVSDFINRVMKFLCNRPASCQSELAMESLVEAVALTLEGTLCKQQGHEWNYMTYESGVDALQRAQSFLRDESTPTKGPNVQAINQAATVVQKFYFGEDFSKRPFSSPLISPLLPPATVIPGSSTTSH